MKRILLATDGSPCADDGAWFLAHLPHDERVEIVVVSVIQLPPVGSATAVGPWVDTILQHDRRRAMENFAKVEAMFEGANVTLRHIVHEGPVGASIVAIAKSQSCDFLVIGARGHSGIERMLLGSTSDYVATHAPCSVLVFRPTGMRESVRPARIVIAYDDTGPAQAAIQEIAEIRWGSQPHLHVVSISLSSAFQDPQDPQAINQAVKMAADQLRESGAQVDSTWFEHSHVGEGLVQYLEAQACDIAVLGETPRTRLGRVLLGSASRFVLRHAPCSVWITRNRMLQGVAKEE